MKNSILFGGALLALIFVFSCKSNNYLEFEAYYILEFYEGTTIEELQKKYQEFKISDIKRVSKSKFQYSTRFNCDNKECAKLEEQLNKDKSIKLFFPFVSGSEPVNATKGSKAHRTGPIGSQSKQ